MTLKLLHFADAHIDAITGGRRDPASGFPVRALDFLNAMDQIIDRAISEPVDLVLFAGDAYRDATPTPTWQREWGRRIKRLSDAKIPLLMIAGNHDLSPAANRASALQDADTFQVPYIHLAKQIRLWTPQDLDGAQAQVITIPWFSRSILSAAKDTQGEKTEDQLGMLLDEITRRVEDCKRKLDPSIPAILMAHYSVVGAEYHEKRAISFGQEMTLSGSLVKDPIFAYTALGHIHKYQDLNLGSRPPVIYSGSIERVNFGEIKEEKGFVLAELTPDQTRYEFIPIRGRRFYSEDVTARDEATFMSDVLAALPSEEEAQDAMVRLAVFYPKDWETCLDEKEIRQRMSGALSFQLVRNPVITTRVRLEGRGVASLTPAELLEQYCDTSAIPAEEKIALQMLAQEIFIHAGAEL